MLRRAATPAARVGSAVVGARTLTWGPSCAAAAYTTCADGLGGVRRIRWVRPTTTAAPIVNLCARYVVRDAGTTGTARRVCPVLPRSSCTTATASFPRYRRAKAAGVAVAICAGVAGLRRLSASGAVVVVATASTGATSCTPCALVGAAAASPLCDERAKRAVCTGATDGTDAGRDATGANDYGVRRTGCNGKAGMPYDAPSTPTATGAAAASAASGDDKHAHSADPSWRSPCMRANRSEGQCRRRRR